MWHCPKSAHQAAINSMKPERDREAAQAMAAQMKLRRAREAEQALKESEIGSLFCVETGLCPAASRAG